ncbi:hypothetical protein JKA74_06335 [Marivirga sp. S37H4]|uniref:PorV/PorQ family protein n=1 Tax=Marivirga aurantiaca TaxID=2802615 RepID=A0A934WWZ6_9BACT|nr:hypothetical protein [Marivirga aurantiaca]MBK6264648.1 hypothetical protein [Marivirga aurantiaca]
MRKIILFTTIMGCFISAGFSQSIYAPIGGRAIGMGDASVTISDLWAGFQNTAGISQSDKFEVGANYENRYGMDGFNFMALGISSPIPSGNAFIGVFRFGDEFYNEHKVSLGYATEIGIIQLGGRANYLQYQIMGFGTKGTYSIDFGGIANLTPQLVIGAQALNITQSVLSNEDSQAVPTLLKFGASYRPKAYFMLNTEIEKDIQKKSLMKIGAEYNFLEKFYLRSGVQSGSFQTFYGLGFKYLSLQWDYALSNHPELGFSHAISMQYALRKK